MKKTALILIFASLAIAVFAKVGVEYKSQMITIHPELKFTEAIQALEVMAQKYEAKKIVNMSNMDEPIGVPVNQMYWKDALELIVRMNYLLLDELPGAYVVKDLLEDSKNKEAEISEKKKVDFDAKQIKISSIFVKADKSFLNSIGINWDTFINGKVTANVGFSGAQGVADNLFQASGSRTFSTGSSTIDVETLFKIIESNQKGSVMARPNLIVLSEKIGKIQVGEDFSVKTVDDAGNISDKFFSTGIIMEVQPTIIEKDSLEAIHLIAKIEKSSAVPGELSTIIQKSYSDTQLTLYDGEETIIAGLYDTDETIARSGIPILKDLPWWFFGVKYLFGYNRTERSTREMIIILKAEIVEPIETRIEKKDTVEKKLRDLREEKRQFKNINQDFLK